jgi:hypothetical protein
LKIQEEHVSVDQTSIQEEVIGSGWLHYASSSKMMDESRYWNGSLIAEQLANRVIGES